MSILNPTFAQTMKDYPINSASWEWDKEESAWYHRKCDAFVGEVVQRCPICLARTPSHFSWQSVAMEFQSYGFALVGNIEPLNMLSMSDHYSIGEEQVYDANTSAVAVWCSPGPEGAKEGAILHVDAITLNGARVEKLKITLCNKSEATAAVSRLQIFMNMNVTKRPHCH